MVTIFLFFNSVSKISVACFSTNLFSLYFGFSYLGSPGIFFLECSRVPRYLNPSHAGCRVFGWGEEVPDYDYFCGALLLGLFRMCGGLVGVPICLRVLLAFLYTGYIGNLLGFTENLNLRLKVAIIGSHCGAASHCTFRHCLTCGYSFFLTCAIFPIFFAHDCSLYSYFRFCLSHIQANLCLIQEYTHTYSES